ncbi:MAG: transketolase [Anaplasmataceae bacterium]|nr:transketolase [Anaplasmataceae bacterium]
MADIAFLEKKSRLVRFEVLEAAVRGGKGHLGGTYSCVDLLVALYYGGLLKFDPKNTNDPERDRFILSKGHACLAVYSIYKDLEIISPEKFRTYGQDGGLGGQLDINLSGVDFNTGSLGHSVGVAAGMALAAKKNNQSFKAATLIGDAELFEGSIWEAMMFASENKLNNLVVIIDRNRLSVTASLEDDSVFENFEGKVKSFGWNYYEANGHDFVDILKVFENIKVSTKPSMVVANTVKGKGVSFMENGLKWHSGLPSTEEVERARQELKIED